jgi:hypothetical protein
MTGFLPRRNILFGVRFSRAKTCSALLETFNQLQDPANLPGSGNETNKNHHLPFRRQAPQQQ